MVPNEEPSDDGSRPTASQSTIEPGELYVVVRKAVEDAILGVLGTLLLVGIGLLLVWFGVTVAVSSHDWNVVSAVAGVFVTLVGLYVAGSALDLLPSVGDLV